MQCLLQEKAQISLFICSTKLENIPADTVRARQGHANARGIITERLVNIQDLSVWINQCCRFWKRLKNC